MAQDTVNGRVVNYGGADPIQGFDVGVFAYDMATGRRVLFGQFTSFVLTIRNATESYIEFGQRIGRMLDGEYQMAWVAEKGMLDFKVIQQSFGFHALDRRRRPGRSPRFRISFSCDSVDQAALEGVTDDGGTGVITQDLSYVPGQGDSPAGWARSANAVITLLQCKLDSWHMAASAGRSVTANQWQGVCEGYMVNGHYVWNTEGRNKDTSVYNDQLRTLDLDGSSSGRAQTDSLATGTSTGASGYRNRVGLPNPGYEFDIPGL